MGRSPMQTIERFIPASAGNTVWGRLALSSGAVHPRERGEHTSINSLILKQQIDGSKSTDFSSAI